MNANMEKMIHFKSNAIHNSVENGFKNTSQSKYSAESTFGIYISSFIVNIGGKKVPNCALAEVMIIGAQKNSIEPSNTSLTAPSPSKIVPFDRILGDPNFMSFQQKNYCCKIEFSFHPFKNH